MLRRIAAILALMTVALSMRALTVSSSAGKLANVVDDHSITILNVHGTIDARDFKFINDNLENLQILLLSKATIVEYNSTVDDGLLAGVYSYASNTFPYCALAGNVNLIQVALPENLVSIDYGAFAGCSSISYMTFPQSLEKIGDDAFNSCSALKMIEIGGNIAYLGNNAFMHCSSLRSVVVNPEVPLAIGKEAFADCGSLFMLTIGPTVTAIGDGAFTGCAALKSFTVMSGSQLEDIGDKAFYESGLESINFNQIPNLKHLGAWALARTKLSTVTLPPHVKRLEEGTLFYDKELTRLELPNSLTYLPDYMLAGCENIKGTAFIPQRMGNIGDYALYNQSQHNSITVPFGVYYIGTQAMAGMTGLDEITSEALAVPELGDDVWAGLNPENVHLYVNQDSYESYGSASQWMDFIIEYGRLRGDVNSDGFVNVDDAIAERRYLVDGISDNINTNLTDVSRDGEVDVADIVSIYNIINGNLPVNIPPYRTYFDDFIDGNGVAEGSKKVTLNILLDNAKSYTAFELGIVVPSHISIDGVELSDRCVGHELYFKQESSNIYSILCFSPAGDEIEGSHGVLLSLDISSTKPITINDEIELQRTVFVDSQENVFRRYGRTLNILGITAVENIQVDDVNAPVDVYNTQGQLLRTGVPSHEATNGLPAGIYIVGGKKVIVR